MGDIVTHGTITSHVVEQLKRAFGPEAIPEEEYTYLELGNFLTDVKQFRDPPAFHRAREKAREGAQAQAGAASGPVGVDQWATAMFGRKTAGPRHGWVPEFLRLLAYALTHHVFDTDGLAKQAATQQPPGATSPLIPAHPIDPKEVARVLDEHFDQYWPHDHMDFPPVRPDDMPNHRKLPFFQRRRTGLIGFLEYYTRYLSEELSKLESDWASANAARITEQARRDFLVRLGTLLHAVEDYYFHSNFAELRQLQVLRRQVRNADFATPAGREKIFRQGMLGTGLDASSVRLRRILYRRLRYPIFERGDQLSKETSEDASDLLYTGGFYATDVFHTLGGAIEAAERFAFLLGQQNPAQSNLVLVRLTFNEDARRDLVRGGDEAAKALREQHATQLAAGDYRTAIAQLLTDGRLSAQAAARLDQAFVLDQAREADFQFLPGPGGILVTLLADLQRERDESERQSVALDQTVQSITIDRSANDSSSENVGTHSLLSKDSESKEPFRADAVVLAKHAAAGVAAVLARRLVGRVPLTQGVDWDAVLTFFLRFPAFRSRRWEEELLVALRRSGDRFKQPDDGAVVDKPRFPFLGPAKDAKRLAERRAGKGRAALEEYYRRFESDPP